MQSRVITSGHVDFITSTRDVGRNEMRRRQQKVKRKRKKHKMKLCNLGGEWVTERRIRDGEDRLRAKCFSMLQRSRVTLTQREVKPTAAFFLS